MGSSQGELPGKWISCDDGDMAVLESPRFVVLRSSDRARVVLLIAGRSSRDRTARRITVDTTPFRQREAPRDARRRYFRPSPVRALQ